MRACARCGLPVRKQDEMTSTVDPTRIEHKVCPDPVQPQPDHRGKKHAGFQAQLRVAGHVQHARQHLTAIKDHVERGQLGHPGTVDLASELVMIAQQIELEAQAAMARRKELDRG